MIDALPSPHAWIKAALEASMAKQRAVLALVSKEKGSTPRDVGSWILVSEEKYWALWAGASSSGP